MQQAALLALSQHFPREKRSRRQPAWLGLEPAHRRGSRGGSAPRRLSSCGDSALSTQGMGVSGDPAREQLGRAPGLSSKTFGLSPRTARHGDDNARLHCPSACQERFLTVPQSPDSLRKACCVHCSLQQPPPAAGSVGRQSWQKTPFCCLLHVSNSSLLLPRCMSRPFPGLLPAQPARRSLCHTRWNWLDTDKSKSREKILPKRLQPGPSACPPCTPCSPPSRHLALLPPGSAFSKGGKLL